MGWNDRLPEDPYTPPSSYYRDREDYEAWLDYLDARLKEENQTGLTSQNLDPAALAGSQPQKETPRRQSLLSRLRAIISGQKTSNEEQEDRSQRQEEDAPLPF
jgi:hypothetical protein